MSSISALGPSWLDPVSLLDSFGGFALAGLAFIIFAECGLLIGFFLPGDSLLFTAGLLVSTHALDASLWLTCLVITAGAVAGNLCGYWIGRLAGPSVFNRPDSRLFKQEYVDKTHAFFEKYGPRAIMLARFVPIVRTFITVMAGVGRMNFRVYAIYSTIGGIVWGTGVTVVGYFLGKIQFIQDHIDVILVAVEGILIAIVVISIAPVVFGLLRSRRAPDDRAAR